MVDGPPLLILGIRQRCGTNFLAQLLALHPDLSLPEPLWEDFLVRHARWLATYVQEVHATWGWGVGQYWEPGTAERLRRELWRSLGDGLLNFLSARTGGRRVLTKTPSVGGLEYVSQLFPEARPIVLVRDGRAVADSAVRSTPGLSYERVAREWAQAARAILRCRERQASRFLLVRYEDLYRDVEGELRRIFDYAGLDARRYDMGAARSLPVFGSSSYGRRPGEEVHWRPVERRPDFNPLERFAGWPEARQRRFDWLAGRELEALGYSRLPPPRGLDRLKWTAWNLLGDIRWAACLLAREGKALPRRVARKLHRWRSL